MRREREIAATLTSVQARALEAVVRHWGRLPIGTTARGLSVTMGVPLPIMEREIIQPLRLAGVIVANAEGQHAATYLGFGVLGCLSGNYGRAKA